MEKQENFYVVDIDSVAETARLINQHFMLVRLMGLGPVTFPKEWNGKVLDVACGAGNWAIDLAYQYPEAEVQGIDISELMVRYAYAQTEVQGINATFGVMDIRKPLDFSACSFDYVHARFLSGVLKKEEWENFLQEMYRILKPGGTLCLLEPEWPLSSSLPLEMLCQSAAEAMRKQGRNFSPSGRSMGTAMMLPSLLRRVNLLNIQTRSYYLDFSSEAIEHVGNSENCEVSFILLKNLLLDTGVLTEMQFTTLYNQMQVDLRQPFFCGGVYFLASWGIKEYSTEWQDAF